MAIVAHGNWYNMKIMNHMDILKCKFVKKCYENIINKKTLDLSNNFDDDPEESPIVYPANLLKDIEVYLVADIGNVPTQTQNINSIETFGELDHFNFASDLPCTSRNEENRAEVPKVAKGNSRIRPTTSALPKSTIC
ncbi:hypothetical protein FQR65_LT07160 [Abscondita terminalis]|nr:hypothetical protein FQR65_LT07160 [Abscondita terminalis]